MGEATLEQVTTRRQLLAGTRALLAVSSACALAAGWNLYGDLSSQRSPRRRRRKWKWSFLAVLWLGLAYWCEHRDSDDQRDSSIV
ncbi:MAG: hypothetical protein ABW352_05915 [Polyangiales bacterium]